MYELNNIFCLTFTTILADMVLHWLYCMIVLYDVNYGMSFNMACKNYQHKNVKVMAFEWEMKLKIFVMDTVTIHKVQGL